MAEVDVHSYYEDELLEYWAEQPGGRDQQLQDNGIPAQYYFHRCLDARCKVGGPSKYRVQYLGYSSKKLDTRWVNAEEIKRAGSSYLIADYHRKRAARADNETHKLRITGYENLSGSSPRYEVQTLQAGNVWSTPHWQPTHKVAPDLRRRFHEQAAEDWDRNSTESGETDRAVGLASSVGRHNISLGIRQRREIQECRHLP
ncbi:hypothetical protein Micbo1qcDRAFT_169764 [Microdochium bolleyi]|uniref:Chromo domain-containing protein n=1 Tax=Microdochium bolleyi TaxID=196109 RepID=A0A136IJ45_9PEZI|nr:hypothetical protein Micbo1qcDRAFT_169764 [Microdochium bolleyi]